MKSHASPRVFVAGYQHETNTFAPTLADWSAFLRGDSFPAYMRGAQLLDNTRGVNLPIGGFIDEAERLGWTLIPSAWAGAIPSAHVTQDAFERIARAMADDLRAALTQGPLDGIYLDLHGAAVAEPPAAAAAEAPAQAETQPAPTWWWVLFSLLGAVTALFYLFLSFARLEIFKMLLSSFFPLMMLILAVLGSIVFGLATPTEAAAMGALGGFLLAAAYRQLTMDVLRESVYLTAKTSAMVCWLFVGSSIFSAAFALLGGQELVERWVLSLDMTPTQFMLLSQFIIFILGWPLEWTEIIVIFMPIFIPLLGHFHIDPLFFGLLVALNLQTAFLSPPVAMAAFYLKGVAPPHVRLNQIFIGMMPFMGIQVVALALLYLVPDIGLLLPRLLYR